MKIYVDEELIYELSDIQKRVIKNDIQEEIFDADMKRRIRWVIEHKYNKCLKRLKDEWTSKLKAVGFKSLPLDDEEFAKIVFNRPEYKDRNKRDTKKK